MTCPSFLNCLSKFLRRSNSKVNELQFMDVAFQSQGYTHSIHSKLIDIQLLLMKKFTSSTSTSEFSLFPLVAMKMFGSTFTRVLLIHLMITIIVSLVSSQINMPVNGAMNGFIIADDNWRSDGLVSLSLSDHSQDFFPKSLDSHLFHRLIMLLKNDLRISL